MSVTHTHKSHVLIQKTLFCKLYALYFFLFYFFLGGGQCLTTPGHHLEKSNINILLNISIFFSKEKYRFRMTRRRVQ